MKVPWLLIITLLSFPVLSEEVWEQVESDSNITVYTKLMPGNPYKSFKAVAIVQSTPDKLFEILDDVSSYNQWFAYSHSVRLLGRNQNKKYVYMETSFPWPFSNEDMIYTLSINKNRDGEVKLILEGKPDYIPTVNGVKRMRDATGYFLLKPEEEHTIVTYVMHTNLSGDIPPWLANKYIHSLPFKTLNNLISIVQKT